MPKNLENKKSIDAKAIVEEKKKPSFIRIVWTVIMVIVTISMVGFAFSGLGSNLTNSGPTVGGGTSSRTEIGTVNGIPLYQDDFNDLVTRETSFYEMEGRNIPVEQTAFLRSSVLDHMIEGALLETQASKYNVTVSDADIQAERTKEIASAGLAAKLSLSANATQAEIDNALTSLGHPPTTVMFSDDKIKSQLLQQKVKDAIDALTVTTAAQARAYYTQWHTQHILIGNKTRSDAQAQIVAQKINALALAPGANFTALAQKYSDDPGTAKSGGDDHWIDNTTQYVPEFKTAAFALKAGQITQTPVKSPQFGYFIIKCDATKPNLPKDFDKNTAKYISTVQDSERQTNFQTLITNLKNDPSTKINITDPRLLADRGVASVPTLGDPGAVNLAYKAALANYLTALKDTNLTIVDKGAINAEIAAIYDTLKDPKSELSYLKDAVDQTKDSGLAIQLGQLYLKSNDTNDAVTTFKSASSIAWSDPDVHYQLLSIYKTMKRPDLVQSEQAWMQNYEQQQKAAQANPQGGMPGGMPGAPGGLPPGVQVVPSSGGSSHAVTVAPSAVPTTVDAGQPQVHLVPSSPAPSSPAKPAQ